jgi:putative endonuclease
MSPCSYGVVYDWDMRLNMNDEQLQTIEQVNQFIDSSQEIKYKGINVQEKYQWIEEVLRKFKYKRLKRNGKGILRRYIEKVTGSQKVGGSNPPVSTNKLKYYTYILKSDLFNRIYIVSTDNIDRRVIDNNTGNAASPKPFRPWKVIHTETFSSLPEALKSERERKSWKSRVYMIQELGLGLYEVRERPDRIGKVGFESPYLNHI